GRNFFEARPRALAGGHASVGLADGAACRVVFLGRLYYRDDHAAGVRARRPDLTPRPADSDAALALAVYRALGADGLRRLEGDFALALYDGPARRLWCARDPMGGYPLFWVCRGGAFAIGTDVGPLLDFVGRRDLDPEYVADFLAMYGQWGEGLTE